MLRIANCRGVVFMIDYVSIAVDTDKPVEVGKKMTVTQSAGHRTKSFTPVDVSAGEHAPAFQMRYNTKTKRLEFEGSPIMFTQGHNAFGSDDLRWLVQQTIPLVFATIQMPMPRDVMQRIDDGDYSISAVDVTKHFRLSSGTVEQFCEWIRVHASASLKATPASRGIGVRLLPDSRSTAYYLYDKAHYFTDRIVKSRNMVLGRLPQATFERIGTNKLFNRMRKELESVLRVEAKFKRSLSAKRWQLNKGSAWTPETADQLFFSATRELPLGSISSGNSFEHLVNDELGPLESRIAIALWLARRDASAFCSSPSKYFRLRKVLLDKHGIDLSQPPPLPSPFHWTELVQPCNALTTPSWAVDNFYVHTEETMANGVSSPYRRAWLDHASAA